MTPPDDIVNDVKAFISLWKDVENKIKTDSEKLQKEYGVTNEEYDYDDGSYSLTIGGIIYNFDWNEEQLMSNGKVVSSGPAYDYVIKNNAAIRDAYHIIESEMTKRGWYYDPDEYDYYISKNGWKTTLPYFAESIDEIDKFEWDADLLE